MGVAKSSIVVPSSISPNPRWVRFRLEPFALTVNSCAAKGPIHRNFVHDGQRSKKNPNPPQFSRDNNTTPYMQTQTWVLNF
jgi:hypothetical protein